MNDKRKILLIEDNKDDQMLTIRAFKKNGIVNEIKVIGDGEEAMDFLFGEEKNELPQLILLDLKLPKVEGLEVLKKIRETKRTRRLPVVVLTSSKDESDLINSYDLGCNSYIQKPVKFDEFLEAVHQLGLYWLLLNQVPPLSDY